MTPPEVSYHQTADIPSSVVREDHIEDGFIGRLQGLKYEYRPDITNRATLEANFREKFESLNRVHLTDGEFARLLDEIITPDVLAASKLLRQINAFIRLPQRGTAYQPRVQPWEWDRGYECVLKERRIVRAREGDTTICGVPSERGDGWAIVPRALPCPGFHPSLVCTAPLGHESR